MQRVLLIVGVVFVALLAVFFATIGSRPSWAGASGGWARRVREGAVTPR
ncbi:MAG: hypothetical protein Q8S33_11570 [Myxococcales bacterium]|nr:hypothetical protein [Myxococcales bacterium]